MNKNYFFSAIAAGLTLFATSCSSDDPAVTPAQGSGVNIAVNLPEQIESRQFSLGTNATKLTYAVYQAGTTTPLKVCPQDDGTYETTGTATFVNKHTNIKLNLAKDVSYDIVFWAQNEKAPYEFSATGQYVETNFNGTQVNDDIYDAFTNHITIEKLKGPLNEEVTLHRPFAQINIGTSDYKEAAAAGLTVENVSVTMPSYTALSLVSMAVGSVVDGKFVAVPATEESLPVTIAYAHAPVPSAADYTFPIDGYKYLTMNYVLVPEKRTNVNIQLNVNGSKWITFNNVPVARNHRTNIYGSLLTNPAEFTVIIDNKFTGDLPFTPKD